MKNILKNRKVMNVVGLALSTAIGPLIYTLGKSMGEWTGWEQANEIVQKMVKEVTTENNA